MDSDEADLGARARLQSAIDDQNANVAILDRTGTIEMVNTGWIQFAIENGAPDAARTGPGTNYFEACSVEDNVDGDFARRAVDGISQVLRRTIPAFALEYPCHSPQQERWFVMLVAPAGADGAIVTHVDVTGVPHPPA